MSRASDERSGKPAAYQAYASGGGPPGLGEDLVELLYRLGRELHFQRSKRVIEPLDCARADDRRSHDRMSESPR